MGGLGLPAARKDPLPSPRRAMLPTPPSSAQDAALLFLDLAGKWLAFDYCLVLVSAAAVDTPVAQGADPPPPVGEARGWVNGGWAAGGKRGQMSMGGSGDAEGWNGADVGGRGWEGGFLSGGGGGAAAACAAGDRASA